MGVVDVIEDLYRQRRALMTKRLKPTAIMVGDLVFRDFWRDPASVNYVRAMGNGEYEITGLPVAFAGLDKPFTVLTNGERD